MSFDPKFDDVSLQDVLSERETLSNIRLADGFAVDDALKQRQVFRPYYEFLEYDVDRYCTDDGCQQVFINTRNLNSDLLPAKNWVNTKLKFTHGQGAVVVSVTDFSKGLANFLVKDIPPVSALDGVEISNPDIYYGLSESEHVFINTSEPEFDYPAGEGSEFSRYDGTGGMVLGSRFSFRRFALANRLDGLRVMTSGVLRPDSRVLYRRNIEERVRKVAPFLRLDSDPFVVISDDGDLYYIWNAYTTTDKFPYSNQISGLNYIRNSVKITVDAYNGDVQLYVFDEADPLIRTWRNIFPTLFKPRDQMPEDLLAHTRFPYDLFAIQAQMYGLYHMTDPEIFFNKEDPWVFGQERYREAIQNVIPYYVTIQLPGEAKSEFVLMIPLTPGQPGDQDEAQRRNNLVAWMAGRSDPPNYGKLFVYRLPKGKLIPGPAQVESFIDSDREISKEITLLDQRGSRIIRGNLLFYPIADTILYVEPIYLEAEQASIPKLDKIVVGIGEQVAWGDDFDEALRNLFREIGGGEGSLEGDDIPILISEALLRSEAYKSLTGEGRFEEAGKELNQLILTLERLNQLIETTESK